MKKPMFALPLKGEYEQMVNALTMQRLGFGEWAQDPTLGHLERFLSNLGRYRRALEGYRFDCDAAGRKLVEVIGRMEARPGSGPASDGRGEHEAG